MLLIGNGSLQQTCEPSNSHRQTNSILIQQKLSMKDEGEAKITPKNVTQTFLFLVIGFAVSLLTFVFELMAQSKSTREHFHKSQIIYKTVWVSFTDYIEKNSKSCEAYFCDRYSHQPYYSDYSYFDCYG